MRKIPTTVRPDGPAYAAVLCCGLALLLAGVAQAALPVFEVLVPLQGPTAGDRAASLREALRTVAVRASGRPDAGTNSVIAAADPARYVQRYATTADRRLKVGFDRGALDGLLQQAGLPRWPAERPVVAVEAPGVDPAQLERAAHWRGVPIGATAAGAGRATLVGVASGGQYAWTFSHAGRTVAAQGSVRDGIDLAADTLAARYAPASTRATTTVVLRVGGVDDLAAYAGLLSYLEALSLVRELAVEALEGTVVRLRVVVQGDRELLGKVVALDGVLQPVAGATEGTEPAVDFRYAP